MSDLGAADRPVGSDDGWVHPGVPPAPRSVPHLSDRGSVVLALAACLGAWWASPVPRWAGGVVVATALVLKRPNVLVAGVFLLAASLGQRAVAGLEPPEPGPFRGIVTLVSDPRESAWGVRADVRADGKRYEVHASGGSAGTLGRSLAGERLLVRGRIRSPARPAPWLKPRHVVAILAVERAELVDAGRAPWRAANRFRRLLQRGAEVMDRPAQALYGGFLLGDDRGLTPEVVDDFRASGLTHVLVVSGSNVAYVLVLASPLTNRLKMGWRWAATLAIVAWFALLTRFEPSVVRASAMAAVAVTASLAGRPTAAIRVLSLAVAGVVLVDPLLVHSVGFQLSVAASAGIVSMSRSLARSLPGPRLLREALGVTLAAQLAVAPVLIPRFGGMPVVAIAANLVAVPVAGFVTTWGLPAGVLAGLCGPGLGRWLHLPTAAGIECVAATARISAGLPLGELSTTHLVVLTSAAVLGLAARRSTAQPGPVADSMADVHPLADGDVAGDPDRSAALGAARDPWIRSARVAAGAVAAVALLAPGISLRHPPFASELLPGVVVYRSGGATVLVIDRAPSPSAALEALRRAGVRRIDMIVGVEPKPALLRALRHRWPVGLAVPAAPDLDLTIGDLRVRTVRHLDGPAADRSALAVDVTRTSP